MSGVSNKVVEWYTERSIVIEKIISHEYSLKLPRWNHWGARANEIPKDSTDFRDS